jgi:hypothetical protein
MLANGAIGGVDYSPEERKKIATMYNVLMIILIIGHANILVLYVKSRTSIYYRILNLAPSMKTRKIQWYYRLVIRRIRLVLL